MLCTASVMVAATVAAEEGAVHLRQRILFQTTWAPSTKRQMAVSCTQAVHDRLQASTHGIAGSCKLIQTPRVYVWFKI